MAESSPTSTSLTDQTPQSTSSSSSTADVLPKEIDGILSLRKTKSKASVISRRVRQAVFDTGAPTVVDSQGQKILSFTFNDPDDPRNWPKRKKSYVVAVGILVVTNSTLGTSLPSNAVDFIAQDLGVSNSHRMVLLISLFLVGLVLGPIIFGPLSETYGRRIILLSSFFAFTIFTMACALAPSWAALLVFRLMSGVFASCPVSVIAGLFADMFDDPIARGRALALYLAAATLGPQLGPLISGFLAPFSWRWVFWTGLIVAGLSFLLLAFLPETYGPVILKWRAKRLREDTSDHSIYAALEVEYKGVRQLLTVTLWRPLNMLLFEAIVLFSSLYTALAYALFYTTFEAFPLIFTGIYGMTPGVAGLAYVPMFIGGIFAFVAFTQYDTIFLRAQRASKPWSQVEEYRRLPLACLGGPAYVVSLFWIGWTAHRQIHWSVPMVAGIFFGFGYMLILMALLNYITDAYEIYAASGMAAASFSRSILGALLPIAAKPMYEHLGIAWGNSLLAFFSLGMCVIPFAFIRYGDSIRANSKICSELKERERPISMGVPHASELTADFHAVGECANIPDNDLEVRTVGLITA